MRFALNHIIAPHLSLDAFFAMARDLGCAEVEIRNDLPGAPIQDGTPATEVRAAAEKAGVRVLTINALYPFLKNVVGTPGVAVEVLRSLERPNDPAIPPAIGGGGGGGVGGTGAGEHHYIPTDKGKAKRT